MSTVIARETKTEIVLRTCQQCRPKKTPIVRMLPIFMTRTGISSPSVLDVKAYNYVEAVEIADAFRSCLVESQSEDRRS